MVECKLWGRRTARDVQQDSRRGSSQWGELDDFYEITERMTQDDGCRWRMTDARWRPLDTDGGRLTSMEDLEDDGKRFENELLRTKRRRNTK